MAHNSVSLPSHYFVPDWNNPLHEGIKPPIVLSRSLNQAHSFNGTFVSVWLYSAHVLFIAKQMTTPLESHLQFKASILKVHNIRILITQVINPLGFIACQALKLYNNESENFKIKYFGFWNFSKSAICIWIKHTSKLAIFRIESAGRVSCSNNSNIYLIIKIILFW